MIDMNTITKTNLFEFENQYFEYLKTALGEFKAKLENANMSKSDTICDVNTALNAMAKYTEYMEQHNDVPGYSQTSQIHKDLKALFENMNASLSKEETNNDFLDFDASQILKAQNNHRRELCVVASDHTIGSLRKSGNELREMAMALNA